MKELRGADYDDRQALDRLGTLIGGSWKLDRLLGIGGMAAVYDATHVSGRRAAVKILHRSKLANPELRARFLREHEISARIRHPAALQIWALGMTDDQSPMLMMELLHGASLQLAMKRLSRPSLALVLAIADRLLDFLIVAHAAGVVHRDLKPDNVFVTLDGELKVLDFGVASTSPSRTTDRGIAVGTPSFMAPEQARGGEDEIDARADLFSIGAMMYSLLSGHPLRSAATDAELLRMAAQDPVRPALLAAPDLPRDVASLIDRALAWSPGDRWPDAHAMQLAVRAALARTPAQPSPRALLASLAFACCEDDRDEDPSDRPTYPHAHAALDSPQPTRPEPLRRLDA